MATTPIPARSIPWPAEEWFGTTPEAELPVSVSSTDEELRETAARELAYARSRNQEVADIYGYLRRVRGSLRARTSRERLAELGLRRWE